MHATDHGLAASHANRGSLRRKPVFCGFGNQTPQLSRSLVKAPAQETHMNVTVIAWLKDNSPAELSHR